VESPSKNLLGKIIFEDNYMSAHRKAGGNIVLRKAILRVIII
jgi:hypothetical protein